MKLIMFGINKERNLIIQFPVLIQPHMQQPLNLNQIERVLVSIIDLNTGTILQTPTDKEAIHCFKH